MHKVILLLLLVIFAPSIAFSATYYIANDGSDSSGVGSYQRPWATLSKAFSQMIGGDTLVCKKGVYTGDLNSITRTQHPPVGSLAAHTTVKAEADGEVLFDGQYQKNMFYYDEPTMGNLYCVFEGLIWGRAPAGACNVFMQGVAYVKFLRCGAYDAGTGNASNFVVGRYSQYVLFEDCYAWGGGRFKFSGYQNDHIVFRRCVARNDMVDANHDGKTEPIGTFAFYSVSSGTAQNCIAIDCDQQSHYVGIEVGGWAGCLIAPSTDMDALNCRYDRCVVLNSSIGAASTSQQSYSSKNIAYSNCVFWDIRQSTLDFYSLFLFRGGDTNMRNCTIGQGLNTDWTINSYDPGGSDNDTVFYDNIVCNISTNALTKGQLLNVEFQDYNLIWRSPAGSQGFNVGHAMGANTILDINPIWSSSNPGGALKYIVRCELGNSLSNRSSSGGQIGADCTNLVGKSGTYWGDAEWDEVQPGSLWPFPHEALMRSKMRTYTGGGVNGARGFCADGQSLTKYIWGYLGNPVPSELTRALEGEVENSRGLGVTGVSMVISDGISDSASTDSSGAYAFAGLTPGADYTITPVKEGYTFSPPSRTVSNFSGTLTGLNFTASGLGVEDVVQPQELRVVGSAAQQGTINPTKGDTAKIYFQGTTTGTYECRIFNINRVMVWQDKKEGTNMGIFEWFPKDMPSGAYIVNVQGPGFNQTKKLAVLK